MWDGVDRRRFVRVEYPCLITLRDGKDPQAQSILTHTEDIGVGGVRVIIRQRIDAMKEVDLELDLMDTKPTVVAVGRVCWVKEVPTGLEGRLPRYDTGIQFINLEDSYRQRIQKIVNNFLDKV